MSSGMPENKGRFDQFTRAEVHFLRDVIAVYLSDYAGGLGAGDEETGRRLITEMHHSANWRANRGGQ